MLDVVSPTTTAGGSQMWSVLCRYAEALGAAAYGSAWHKKAAATASGPNATKQSTSPSPR